MTHTQTHTHTHTQTHIVGRTPLDEWSARRIDLYLTTHNSHKIGFYGTGEIRTRNTSKWAAFDQRLRPRGHLERWFSLSLLTISSPHSWTLLFSALFNPSQEAVACWLVWKRSKWGSLHLVSSYTCYHHHPQTTPPNKDNFILHWSPPFSHSFIPFAPSSNFFLSPTFSSLRYLPIISSCAASCGSL